MSVHDIKSKKDAEEFSKGVINDPVLEVQWAEKAFKHAETYFKLISIVPDVATLRLTKHDDAIYSLFRQLFPSFDVSVIDEEAMKSPEGKAQWRPFLMAWEQDVEDYNMGTLLRLDASKDYSEANSTIVPRAQFYSIEIARNREGCQYKPSS